MAFKMSGYSGYHGNKPSPNQKETRFEGPRNTGKNNEKPLIPPKKKDFSNSYMSLAHKLEGPSPNKNKKESWWTRTKKQFSSKNPYGFGDWRGRKGKSTSTADLKWQQKNPKKRGETHKNYLSRIGKPPKKSSPDQRGLLGGIENLAQK